MKINFSKIVSDSLFKNSRPDGSGITKSESLFRAYRAAARLNALNPKMPKSDKLYINLAMDYYGRVLRSSKKKGFIAAHSLGFPVEILYAMDIAPFQLETTGWLLAMLTGETGQLLTAASEVGVAPEICSVHRLMAGAFARQLLPRPNVVLWTNIPCENGAKSGALLARLNACPGFFLDHPYNPATEETEYLIAEFESLIAFLEERSGHKLDINRLAEAITRSNEQIDICREISQLRKQAPSPFPSFTFIRVFMIHLLFGGQPEATVYLKTLRNELAAKASQGTGTVSPERFRLINMNLPPLYFIDALRDIFQEYGAVEVANPFFLDWQAEKLDASQPLQSLARKSFMNPLMSICGTIDRPMLDRLKQCVSDFKIDGAINFAHIGCGSYGGASRLVRDAMMEAGVPTLDLPCDITDPTVVSSEEMREHLERFFELLEDR
jgi:benzoyl-CoA reductase/2-hydroxyglutaryl-CoA dehydratase subunit BcrC/BadD/HgdB